MEKRTLRYWIAFNRVGGMGSVRIHTLLRHYHDLELAWKAPERELEALINNKPTFENLLRARRTVDLDSDLEMVGRVGARAITLYDEEYPRLLKQVPNPPPLLYIKGSLSEIDIRAIGVVGTRTPTDYGLQAARMFTVGLVKSGVTIVSGLAKGIDTAAHKATIVMNGRTLALLGHGIESIYPKENAQLAESIAQNGALLTEFAVGVPPEAGNFPMRNRLISGLALGVIVVEAGEGSGALSTAKHANEQNREVFAVPGSVFNEESIGTNRLIQVGEAKLVSRVIEVLDEFKWNMPPVGEQLGVPIPEPAEITPSKVKRRPAKREVSVTVEAAPRESFVIPDNLTDTESKVVNAFLLTPSQTHSTDDVCMLTALPPAQVTAALTVLELAGIVTQPHPTRYALKNS